MAENAVSRVRNRRLRARVSKQLVFTDRHVERDRDGGSKHEGRAFPDHVRGGQLQFDGRGCAAGVHGGGAGRVFRRVRNTAVLEKRDDRGARGHVEKLVSSSVVP